MATTAPGPFAALIDAAVAFWRGLSRTVLQSAPALVYLGALVVVLAVVLPRWPEGGAVGTGGGSGHGDRDAPVVFTSLPPAVRLPEEVIMRGDDRTPEPQEIPLSADAGTLVIELITSIDLEDLADPDAAFLVNILADEQVVHQLMRRGSDFDHRGRMSLVLDPRAFAIGETYTIRLLFLKDDDIRNGELLYRKSFRRRLPV